MREGAGHTEPAHAGQFGSTGMDKAANKPAAHDMVGRGDLTVGHVATMSDNEQRLRRAFGRGLNMPESAVNESLEYSVTPGWDSVAHMALVASLDATFGITLDTDDVIDLSSYLEARSILGRYGIQF